MLSTDWLDPSSAYREHILNDREFKIAHYHETMAKMIQD